MPGLCSARPCLAATRAFSVCGVSEGCPRGAPGVSGEPCRAVPSLPEPSCSFAHGAGTGRLFSSAPAHLEPPAAGEMSLSGLSQRWGPALFWDGGPGAGAHPLGWSKSGAGPEQVRHFLVFWGRRAQCQQDFLCPGTFPALGLAVVTSPAPWLSRGKLRHGGGRVLLACGGDLMAPWGPHPALPAGLGCAGSLSSVREVMGAPGMGTASLHGTATPEQDGGCVPTKTPAGG